MCLPRGTLQVEPHRKLFAVAQEPKCRNATAKKPNNSQFLNLIVDKNFCEKVFSVLESGNDDGVRSGHLDETFGLSACLSVVYSVANDSN